MLRRLIPDLALVLAVREREPRMGARALLACGLAGCAAVGACAGLDAASSGATVGGQANRAEDAARYGLRVLAPAMPLPVRSGGSIDMRELPPPCEPIPDEVFDESLPQAGCDGGEAPPDEAPFQYALDLHESDLQGVVVHTGVARAPRPWFSSVNPVPDVAYGDRHWTYRSSSGPSVSFGNLVANAPAWGSAAPIGGVQIHSGFDQVGQGELGYSSAFGRLNAMDPAATSGALDYGPSAGNAALRYGLLPALSLEGQVQTAPGLAAHGLGTRLSAGSYGTFEAGATRSAFDAVNAWRYRFGYDVSLMDSVKVGVSTEQVQAGFTDLSSYEAGALDAQRRSTWSAGMPLDGLGTLSGTYVVGASTGTDAGERRLGLQHSMSVASGVQFDLGADRDLVSGDYAMRANISMSVDTFILGRWLRW